MPRFASYWLRRCEDLMELTHVYSFEQSLGDSFWKAQKKAINATECSISQTSYSTFYNGKDLVYFTGFGIKNSSKNLLLSLSTSSADHSPTKRTRKVNELWGGRHDHLQMSEKQPNILLSYRKSLRVNAAGVWTRYFPLRRRALIKFNPVAPVLWRRASNGIVISAKEYPEDNSQCLTCCYLHVLYLEV